MALNKFAQRVSLGEKTAIYAAAQKGSPYALRRPVLDKIQRDAYVKKGICKSDVTVADTPFLLIRIRYSIWKGGLCFMNCKWENKEV